MAFVTNRRLHKYVEDKLRTVLRDKFASNIDYLYTTFIRTTGLYIDERYAQRLKNPEIPEVIIHHPSIDVSRRVIGYTDYLDSEFETVVIPGITVDGTYYDGATVTIPSKDLRGGDYPGSVTIEVTSLKEDKLDDVQAFIADYLLDYENNWNNGLVITDINIGPKSEKYVGNDLFMTGDVDLKFMTTWQSTSSVSTVDVIADIVGVDPLILPDGTTSEY